MAYTPLTQDRWLARIAAVPLNFPQFSYAISWAEGKLKEQFANQGSFLSKAAKNFAGVTESAVRKIAGDEAAKYFNWEQLAKDGLGQWLKMGTGFVSWNLPYGKEVELHDKIAAGKKPDLNIDLGRTVFRNAPSIFLGAAPLGVAFAFINQLVGRAEKESKYTLKDTNGTEHKMLFDPSKVNFMGSEEGNRDAAIWLNALAKDYAKAALPFGLYSATTQELRSQYDKATATSEQRLAKESHLAKQNAAYKFLDSGVGRFVFRNVGACMLSFMAYRPVRKAIIDLIGEPTPDKETGAITLKGGKMKWLNEWLNETAKKSPDKNINGTFMMEMLANDAGFSTHIAASTLIQDAYDKLLNSLEKKENTVMAVAGK